MIDDDLDLERLPFELRRALWAAGFAPELLPEGLSVLPAGPVLEVHSAEGQHLADLPVARLRTFTAGRLVAEVDPMAEGLGLSIDWASAIVCAPPWADHVTVRQGHHAFRVSRSCLVEGWPDEE